MAGIQNIDFSQKIPTTLSSSSRSNQPSHKGSIDYSRLFGWGVAIAVLVFTAGLLAGLKIAELRNFEKTLVKYPAQNGFSNTTDSKTEVAHQKATNTNQIEKSKSAPTASLIIRIGSFSAGRAGELARSLNQLPELESISFYACIGGDDLNPDRLHVFTVPIEGSKLQRLFAGCYSNKEEALKALDTLHNTGVASLNESKLYEIGE